MKKSQESRGKFSKKDLKELEAIESIKSGNVDAYELIYKRYYKFIQHKCFLSVRDYHMSKDMASDILTKIFLNIDKYTVNYTFNSWVWSIVNNYIVDNSRKMKNEPVNINMNMNIVNHEKSNNGDDEQSLKEINSSELDSGYLNPHELMEDKAKNNLRKKFVSDLLSNLNEKERQILIHFYFDELSYEEIADKLNIGLSSMKVTLMRTKEKLRNKVGTMDNILHLFAA